MLDLPGVRGYAARGEFDNTARNREQGVVLPDTDIHARADFGTALADNDISGFGAFACVQLDAKTLSLRIADVTC